MYASSEGTGETALLPVRQYNKFRKTLYLPIFFFSRQDPDVLYLTYFQGHGTFPVYNFFLFPNFSLRSVIMLYF